MAKETPFRVVLSCAYNMQTFAIYLCFGFIFHYMSRSLSFIRRPLSGRDLVRYLSDVQVCI